LFADGITNPKALAELLAGMFNYPVLDLNYYPRSNIVQDILNEEQMQANACVPIFKRGNKIFLAVSRSNKNPRIPESGICFRISNRFGNCVVMTS